MRKVIDFFRLSIPCALPLLTAGELFAQDALPGPTPNIDANGTAQAEPVIVTGSNIPTAAEVGPNPVQVISAERVPIWEQF